MTLYQRLAATLDLNSVLDSFHERVVTDPTLSKHFSGVDLTRLRTHQAAFLTGALGGPDFYEGTSMRDAHRHLNISLQEFESVSDHLMNALSSFGIDDDTVAEIVEILARLRTDIVV